MFSRFFLSAFFGLSLFLVCGVGAGHPADENPDLTLPETTREFRQDRFGMFIHWGIYSVLCDGESVMKDRQLPLSDYERLAQFFNPAEFNAAEWVSLAKSAGMRYITFSARHQDGFAMWGSTASDWNVVKRTPFARDVVKELTEECRREGIKLFLYYSAVDWRHSEQLGTGGSGEAAVMPGDGDGNTTASVNYTHAQLTELLRNYGKIDGVRLGGWANRPEAESQLQPAYNLIRRLQPAALIGNDHGQAPLPGEDFQIGEGNVPGGQVAANEGQLEYSSVPMEVSGTINESRGYRITDHQHKSTRELVHSLVRAAGMDANFLLNVGPMPNGRIQPEFTERLRRVGMWLAKNGESVYATRGGPMAPKPWGVTTHRSHKTYVHVLDPETTSVAVQLPSAVRTARYFSDESDVPYEEADGMITLSLRPERRGELERLIVVETQNYQ